MAGLSTFPMMTSWMSGRPLEMAEIVGVRRLKSQAVNAIDPVTGEPLDPVASVATMTVDIATFPNGRNLRDVPVLMPGACVAGSGMFIVPRVGDIGIVGLLDKNQPVIIGFFIPPNRLGSQAGQLPVALQSGEIAIVAPDTDTFSGMLFLQGGVIRMQSGPNAIWETIPAGDFLSGLCRNFRLVQSGATLEIIERNEADRGTFWRQRIQTQAAGKEENAPFVEQQQGSIPPDELFEELRQRLAEEVIEQKSINGKTFIAFDEAGSRAQFFSDEDGCDDYENAGDRLQQIGGDDSLSVDGDREVLVKGKLTLDVGSQKVVIEVDPETEEAKITIGGTTIKVTKNSVDIDATQEVNINAETVNLGPGSEGIALGETLRTFLETFTKDLGGHTHTGNLGAPTGPAQNSVVVLPEFVSKKVKAS